MSTNIFTDAFNALSNSEFEEIPVDLKTFCESEDFLHFPPLSDAQYTCLKAATQIYKRETLIKLYGDAEGNKRFRQTFNEIYLVLGKGCHAPYTPVYNAKTGSWQRLDSFTGLDNTIAGYEDGLKNCHGTQAFLEGRGEMVRVTTELGFVEDVYVGHKYLVGDEWKRIDELAVGDNLAIACGLDITDPENVSVDEAIELANSVGDSIPQSIWNSDNGILNAFMRTLRSQTGYRASSLTLAVDIQRALLRLGTPARLIQNDGGYEVVRDWKVVDGIYWDKIKSIESIGEGDYWTITSEVGNYVGNGFLSSNSGKDELTSIACAYVVYLLMCLKDPARYYGKPAGDNIDIINVAINAKQARDVFFSRFKNRITHCSWFDGKYNETQGVFEFDKNISVHSGHSEREAWEGYNVIMVVLDEISGFSTESKTGNDNANTAAATYDTYRQSVTSRFAQFGKLVLLSWPRSTEDFILKLYEDAIAEKDTVVKHHTYKRNADLPDGIEENEFTITWHEDHIVRYKYNNVFCLKRPTWDVNPTKHIEDYMRDFDEYPDTTYGRVACMPTNRATDNFFKNWEAVDSSFITLNGVDEDGIFLNDFTPDSDITYYLHIDLAQKRDRAAVAMSHVNDWVSIDIGGGHTEVHPEVKVDLIRWWTPQREKPIDLIEVRDFVVALRRKGFHIGLVTLDRWNSLDTINYFVKNGIKADVLSVGKKHYDDLLIVMYDGRLIAPNVDIVKKELKALKLKGDKVDHPRGGCFVGETRISLLDGSRPMISELDGEQVWVYSCDDDGRIVPGLAKGRMTKMTSDLVDVILDNGAVIRCTPDHPFMLRSGVYKPAKDLRPGVDRLMKITQTWPINGGYERISDSHSNSQLTHHMVALHTFGAIPDGYIVHHINHIKTDNRPENLTVANLVEHSRYHTAQRHEIDAEWREKLYEGLTVFNPLPSTRKRRSESMKSRSNEWYVNKARQSKTFRSDITIDSLLALKDDPDITNANAASKVLGCGRNVIIRILKDYGYKTWDEFIGATGENHKVRAVVPVKLDAPVPVYDLEVDYWNNFALSAGVFVHNSKDLADATCGSVFNTIKYTPRPQNAVIRVKTIKSFQKPKEQSDAIKVPKDMPGELKSYLARARIL